MASANILIGKLKNMQKNTMSIKKIANSMPSAEKRLGDHF